MRLGGPLTHGAPRAAKFAGVLSVSLPRAQTVYVFSLKIQNHVLHPYKKQKEGEIVVSYVYFTYSSQSL